MEFYENDNEEYFDIFTSSLGNATLNTFYKIKHPILKDNLTCNLLEEFLFENLKKNIINNVNENKDEDYDNLTLIVKK